MDIPSIASQFVNLVLKYDWNNNVDTLSDQEVQVLLNTVFAAGFNPKSSTGEGY